MTFGFNTFEDALKFAYMPTHYEREHNIKVVSHKIILDLDDIKLVKKLKDDQTETLMIFFKASTKLDIWFFWIPSETQASSFTFISKIYDQTNLRNTEVNR